MLPLVVAALLGACGLFIVLAPLFAPGRVLPRGASESETGLGEREAAAKTALRDIEFDRQLGNLAEHDYRTLRERYRRRALAAMKGRYDQERALDDAIETRVRALRDVEASKPPANMSKSTASRATTARPSADRRATPRKQVNGGRRSRGRS